MTYPGLQSYVEAQAELEHMSLHTAFQTLYAWESTEDFVKNEIPIPTFQRF